MPLANCHALGDCLSWPYGWAGLGHSGAQGSVKYSTSIPGFGMVLLFLQNQETPSNTFGLDSSSSCKSLFYVSSGNDSKILPCAGDALCANCEHFLFPVTFKEQRLLQRKVLPNGDNSFSLHQICTELIGCKMRNFLRGDHPTEPALPATGFIVTFFLFWMTLDKRKQFFFLFFSFLKSCASLVSVSAIQPIPDGPHLYLWCGTILLSDGQDDTDNKSQLQVRTAPSILCMPTGNSVPGFQVPSQP